MAILEQLVKLFKFLWGARWKTYAKIGISTIVVWCIWKIRAKKHPTIFNRPGFLPIIGHLHYDLGLHDMEGKERYQHWADTFLGFNKDLICTSRIGGFITVFLMNPKLIKFVFETNFEDFAKSDNIRNRLVELLGDGIFASDPPRWRQHRKIGSKMFSMR
eukprot:136064_1